MSKHFYEFWGNYYLNLARGQQQMDNLAILMKQWGRGMSDITALFGRCYGLKPHTTALIESMSQQSWQKAMADFQRSWNPFAALWGWVPQTEYQRVVRERDTLKQKIQDQDAVIRQLRDLLNEEGRGHTMLIDHWKRSFEEQNAQFQSLMESIGSSFAKDR